MPLQIEATGLIYDARGRPVNERIAYFTSLFRASTGEWVAGCQIGDIKHGAKNTVRLFVSTDQARTWNHLPTALSTDLEGVPGSLAGAEIVEPRPGEWMLFATWFDRSDPARPLFDPETEGILRSRQLRAVSTDRGQTWSAWETIATPGLTGCAITGPAVQWTEATEGTEGTLAFAFESFKEFDDPHPARHAAWLLLSKDHGRTFNTLHRVAQDPENRIYYWDQRLCPAGSNGEYVALFWTHDRELKKDLHVHFLRSSIHAGAHPLPAETNIPGQIAAPLMLGDGRILAFVVDRARPANMSLWISRDNGHTWPESERLIVYSHEEQAQLTQGLENVDFAQYWEDMGKWTFGHPAMQPMPDGRVLLGWYAGSPNCLSLHWARVTV